RLRRARGLEYDTAEFIDRFSFWRVARLSPDAARHHGRCRSDSSQSECSFGHRILPVDASVRRIRIAASTRWTLTKGSGPQTKLTNAKRGLAVRACQSARAHCALVAGTSAGMGYGSGHSSRWASGLGQWQVRAV